jgi:type II secretory pathway component PulF
MPSFAYVARNLTGQKVTGVLDAANEREAAGNLAAQSLFPIEVKAAANKSLNFSFGGGRVKGQDMATFYSQLASLLRSGVPMLRSLTVLSEQSSNARLSEVLKELKTRVEEGEPIGDAMARFPRVFNDMGINMVRAGTEGGFLEDGLERVAAFTELQEDLKGRTASALAYPVFLATMGTIVVTILLVFFVPSFDKMFERLRKKGEMPQLTEYLLMFSTFLRDYGLFMLAGIAIIGVIFYSQLKTERGQETADRVKLKIPVLGGILMSLAVARFCRILGTLLGNGVPILRSLEISRSATGNRLLSQSIANASENITAGESLAKPLQQSGHFPQTVVEMINVAEESNSLEKVLPQIAETLEKRTFRQLDMFVKLLEPAMLLVMAMVVMVVVLALMVPVIKSSSAI